MRNYMKDFFTTTQVGRWMFLSGKQIADWLENRIVFYNEVRVYEVSYMFELKDGKLRFCEAEVSHVRR